MVPVTPIVAALAAGAALGLKDTASVAMKDAYAGLKHRSQHHVMLDDPADTERWRRVVSREWAVVAWPSRAPTTPLLTDIFDGLP